MNKKDTILLLVFVYLLTIIITCNLTAHVKDKTVETNLYPKSGTVIYVDHDADVILIEDFSGHRWIYSGAEDWLEGDNVSMIMDNNGTEQIKDDEIISIRYEGWSEGE